MMRRCIRVCLVFILVLSACELAVRGFFFLTRRDIFVDTANIELFLYQRHPFLEYSLRPNVELHRRGITMRINSLGFRGKEFDPEDKRPFRVFVLGGSSVFNRNSVPFCELLEDELKARYPSRNFEIVNAGVSGYTTSHSLANLAMRILNYNPDALIVYHSWNDIKTWPYVNRRFGYGELWQKIYCGNEAGRALLTLANKSYVWLATTGAFREIFHRLYKTNREIFLITKLLKDNEVDDLSYGRSIYKTNITSIIALAKKNKVQILLLNPLTLIKAKNSEKEKGCINYEFVHVPREKLIELVDSAGNILAQVAQAEDIPYIDLNTHISQDLVNLEDQIHLTSTGNKAVAEYLAGQWDRIWQPDNAAISQTPHVK
jgi:lysophospholipase L1-like esterase